MRPDPVRPKVVTSAFVLVAVATLTYFVAESATLPVLPLYVRGPLGGDDIAVGLAVGAFSLTALLIRPWAGRLADRRGRRLPMVLGAAIFGVSVLGYLVSRSVAVLVGMRLLSGVGEAFLFTAAASAVADMAPQERRGEALSFFSMALWTGIAVGPVVGELAIEGARFWRAWLIAGALSGVAALLALRIRERRASPATGAPGRLIQRSSLLPGAIMLTSTLGAAGFFAFVPLYSRQLGLSGSRGVFALFAGIVLAIRFFGARLPDRWGSARTAGAALSVSAVGLAVMAAWRDVPGLFAGTVVYALGQGLHFPALMALTIGRAPAEERGASIATFTGFIDVGFGLGPAALGFVAHAAGYPSVFLVGAGIAVAGLALLGFTRPRALACT